jgi:hypothetical protein
MLNCAACGLTNRPYHTDCSNCARPLQDSATADARRREWDALSAGVREEFERDFDRMREGTLDHLAWLNRHRLTHAIVGAMLVNLTMNGSTLFAAPWTIPVDLALGGAAGLALNRWHGGAWHGIGIFLGAGVVSLLAKLPFLDRDFAVGGWFMTCFALFFVGAMGYLLGVKMDFEHADRSVTR